MTTTIPLSPPARAVRPARPRRAIRLVSSPDKRDALLRAAIRVFARRGFFNAQVADVARVAGVAAGTVYLYFRSKDHLLTSIFDKTMREAIDQGRAALAGVHGPVARLREIARLHLGRLGRDRDLAVVFQVELRQSTKYMERFSSSLLQEYLAMIRDTIADGQANGSFRTDIGATIAAKIFFGALDEMATNWILSRRRYSLVSEADIVADLFVNGVNRRDPEQRRDQGAGIANAPGEPPIPDPRSRHSRKRQEP
jgi:TetR/AcrR family fatty acid metabolism transcriptional regulator